MIRGFLRWAGETEDRIQVPLVEFLKGCSWAAACASIRSSPILVQRRTSAINAAGKYSSPQEDESEQELHLMGIEPKGVLRCLNVGQPVGITQFRKDLKPAVPEFETAARRQP